MQAGGVMGIWEVLGSSLSRRGFFWGTCVYGTIDGNNERGRMTAALDSS